MSATASTQWFWSDWLGDQAVRRLTPAERGVWIDLLALAAAANPVGYVCDDKGRALTIEEITRVTGGSPDEVSKLILAIIEKGVCSRDRSGRLFNRRMVREMEAHAKKAALAAKRSRAGLSGAQATALKYFGKKFLPQHVPREPLGGLSNKNLILSSSDFARASPVDSEEKKEVADEARKRPCDMTLAEIDEKLRAKRANGKRN